MKILTQITISLIFLLSYSYGQTTNFGVGSGTTGAGCSFFGINAGQNNTSTYNTFIGDNSGFGSIKNSGRDNIFLGAYTGYHNFGDKNVFIGNISGYNNTSGYENTFAGVESGFSNTTGYFNCFYGTRSGNNNISGTSNTFLGFKSGEENTTGSYNIFLGGFSGRGNTTGSENIFIGQNSGESNTSGTKNVFMGHKSGMNSAVIFNSVLIGYQAGENSNFTGDNIFIGHRAGQNATGSFSSFIGSASGLNNQGLGNVFLGDGSGLLNVNGGTNVFIGYSAGTSNVNGAQNTFVGSSANTGSVSVNNATAVGFNSIVSASNTVVLGNTSTLVVGGWTATGWVTLSDKNYKKEIKSLNNDLEFILALEPKEYKYDFVKIVKEHHEIENKVVKSYMTKEQLEEIKVRQESDLASAEKRSQEMETGLLAQDVEKAMKETGYDNFSGLIRPEINGGKYSLGYGTFTVPLIGAVKELKKEKDKEIEDLKGKNLELEQRLIALEKMLLNQEESKAIEQKVLIKSEEATMSQNIPNPFSESTVINYFIPQVSKKALIRIVSSKGNVIRDISINEFGRGKLNLSIKDFRSGAYYYSLVIDNEVIETKKMVISN